MVFISNIFKYNNRKISFFGYVHVQNIYLTIFTAICLISNNYKCLIIKLLIVNPMCVVLNYRPFKFSFLTIQKMCAVLSDVKCAVLNGFASIFNFAGLKLNKN